MSRGGIREFNSVDAWVDHAPKERRERSGGYDIGSKWKNSDGKGKGSITLWMHKTRQPAAVWMHDFPARMEWTDKQTERQNVAYWGRGHTCFEAEELLAKQFFRNNDGYREDPPEVCPICKLGEYLYQQVVYEGMSPATEVFRFSDASDTRNNRTLHAGPLTGINDKMKNIPEALRAELKKMGIPDAFRERSTAECSYVLTVVNNDDVRAGIQLMRTKKSVGEGIQVLLRKSIEKFGDPGNFFKHPSAVIINYDAEAGKVDPKHYYTVMLAPSNLVRLTPEIQELLEAEPPAFGDEYQPFNAKKLRAFMEEHACIELPFDEIFADAEKEQAEMAAKTDLNTDGAEFPFGANAKDDPKPRPAPARPAPPPPPAANTIPCEACGKPTLETDLKCPHCGVEFEIEEEAPPPPPPPRQGRRSGI